MKFDLGRIFPEVNTSFSLTSDLLYLLCDQLNALNKEIKHFNKIFDCPGYSIVLIISATRKNNSLDVKGPIVLRKRKEVEFVLHIPYKTFDNKLSETLYVVDNIYTGILFVLNKYKTDTSGVEESINNAICRIKSSPNQFCHQL
jgi:hypothetical protein